MMAAPPVAVELEAGRPLSRGAPRSLGGGRIVTAPTLAGGAGPARLECQLGEVRAAQVLGAAGPLDRVQLAGRVGLALEALEELGARAGRAAGRVGFLRPLDVSGNLGA